MWLVAQRRGGARHGRSQFLGTRSGALAGGPAPGLGWGMRRVRRRAPLVLTALALAAGAGVAASAPGDAPVPTTFPTVQGRPFAQPPVLRSRHGVLATTLTVTPTTYRVAGTPILGKAYDRSFIGPTMRLRPGDTIRLRFRNELAQPTNIHFHGFHTSPSGISDNVLRVIPAHSTQPVVVKVPPDMAPGTYWYHSHETRQLRGAGHGRALGRHRGQPARRDCCPRRLRGITRAGLRPQGPPGEGRRRGDREPRQRRADDPDGQRRGRPARGDPARRDAALAPRQHQRGHLVPAAGRRPALRGRGRGREPVTARVAARTLAAAARQALRRAGPGAARRDVSRLRALGYSTGPAGDDYPERRLATIVSAGAAVRARRAAERSAARALRPRFAAAHVDRRRRIVFSESADGNSFFINGKQFNHDRVDQRVVLGATEEWTILNTSDEQHPFHIHVNDFQVMSINGRRVRARGLQDTVVLPVHGRVVIRLRFTGFTGKFVFHCHILNHEDNGMMAVVQVVDPRRAARPAASGRAARASARASARAGSGPVAAGSALGARHARTWVLCPLAGGGSRPLALPR